MAIQHIHTYLVHPGKGSGADPRIGGTDVQFKGKLFQLLSDIYVKANKECDIEISFNRDSTGKQQNPCRDLVIEYLNGPTLARGRQIAERLERVTDRRSGLGLLFLITGEEDNAQKIVISRFPADSAILAEEDQRNLTVEFLERVFMKSARAYKAVTYQDSSLKSGFWLGQAIDKQINNQSTKLSDYWIAEFLDSDFRTTSAAGTRRLAVALRNAARKSADVSVKTEIAAAVTLAQGLNGRRLNANEFVDHFGLSKPARQVVANAMKVPGLAEERFQFDWQEFSKQVAYRSVELDTGGTLTAESAAFEKIFHREVIDEGQQKVRFSTEGKVVSEKLGKTK
jgi:hypothetical protein